MVYSKNMNFFWKGACSKKEKTSPSEFVAMSLGTKIIKVDAKVYFLVRTFHNTYLHSQERH